MKLVRGCLLPAAAVMSVGTLPFTIGLEGICTWNLVQFHHACVYSDYALTVAFMVALIPVALMGLLFVGGRLVSLWHADDRQAENLSDPGP
jgi:hypothetical protein